MRFRALKRAAQFKERKCFYVHVTFDVPYEEISEYPTPAKAMEAISRYCEASGESCVFTWDDEVEIAGRKYEVCRGANPLNLGYGIICREK